MEGGHGGNGKPESVAVSPGTGTGRRRERREMGASCAYSHYACGSSLLTSGPMEGRRRTGDKQADRQAGGWVDRQVARDWRGQRAGGRTAYLVGCGVAWAWAIVRRSRTTWC